ncbi:hypothetical protein ACIBH1_36730 [Nonomuraea sp. NPDC050663]|uniref:hypothetical protein n=1 Tax=Nonomuraea sp. NPDC050663 TaxID=3364370 RepID=UPI0037B28568
MSTDAAKRLMIAALVTPAILITACSSLGSQPTAAEPGMTFTVSPSNAVTRPGVVWCPNPNHWGDCL